MLSRQMKPIKYHCITRRNKKTCEIVPFVVLLRLGTARANCSPCEAGRERASLSGFEGSRTNSRRGCLFSAGASRALARVESARDVHIRRADKMLAHLSLRPLGR